MADNSAQSYANHGRLDPAYHYFMVPVLLINLLLSFWRVYKSPGVSSVWLVLLSAALLVMAFKVRTYALKVQDRVIRLEERLRMSALLPEPLRSRIGQLTEGQIVALRFASDAEVPALVEKALAGNLKNSEIKKAIVGWRPDYFRV